MYDINNPGWTAVRRQTEPHRDRLAHLFNLEIFNELLPPPDTTIRIDKAMGAASVRKTLLGLLLCSRDHFPG